jgi:oxygen-independent coproporphyrinogen-3 oxidase
LLPPGSLKFFFDLLEKNGLTKDLKEITLEVNPESLTEKKAVFYKNLGVNRISLGIQSFDKTILQKLGRLADPEMNQNAVSMIRKHFENYSLDLIYGIPGQNLDIELEEFLKIKPPHISAYCLNLAPGTPLYEKAAYYKLSDKDLNSQFYKIHEQLKQSAYSHYEISNYCLPGMESQHNLHYWKRNPYLGLGAGASGFLDETRYTNQFLPGYFESLKTGNKPVEEKEILDEKDRVFENLMLGLRLERGVKFLETPSFSELNEKLDQFCREGYLTRENSNIRPTLKGWTLLDGMLKEFYSLLF